jgi:hypothetical protein
MAAAQAWKKTRPIIKRGKDNVVEIKFSPSYQATWKKYGL